MNSFSPLCQEKISAYFNAQKRTCGNFCVSGANPSLSVCLFRSIIHYPETSSTFSGYRKSHQVLSKFNSPADYHLKHLFLGSFAFPGRQYLDFISLR